MRYQVNLYPERSQKAAVVRRGLLRGSLLGILLGIDLLLIGFLVISGFQIRARAASLRESIAVAEAQASQATEIPDLALARQVVQRRLARVDWAAMLGSLAETIPRDLLLTRIQGNTGRSAGGAPGMDLEGAILGGSRDLNSVIIFMQTLRDDPVVAGQFPRVDLGTARGEGLQDFEIVLQGNPAGAPPAPQGTAP